MNETKPTLEKPGRWTTPQAIGLTALRAAQSREEQTAPLGQLHLLAEIVIALHRQSEALEHLYLIGSMALEKLDLIPKPE